MIQTKRRVTIRMFVSLAFILLAILSGKTNAFHSGGYPPGHNYDSIVKQLGIPNCVYFYKANDVQTAGTYCLNKRIFEEFHIVIYGDGGMTRQYYANKTLNGLSKGEWRYFGFNEHGFAVSNPNYPDDKERTSTYLTNYTFAYQPWNHPDLLYKTRQTTHKSYFPDPTYNRQTNYDKSLLGGAYETYRGKDEPGNFLSVNKNTGYAWLKKDPNGVFYNYTNNNLSEYASVFALPTEYTSGVINMYTMSSGCTYGYCYGTFPIAPKNYADDWIDFACYNEMTVKDSPFMYGKAVSSATTKITLNGNNKGPTYNATVTYYWKGSGTKYTKKISMKAGETLTVDLKDNLKFPKTGTQATLVYEIVAERDKVETLWNKKGNNNCSKTIDLAPENNASVTLKSDKTKVDAGQTFKGSFAVKSAFHLELLDAPTKTTNGHARLDSGSTDASVKNNGNKATVRIYKGSNLLETTSYSYSDLAYNQTKTITIASQKELTEIGTDYKAVVCIPVYYSLISEQAESATDNCSTVTFEVIPIGDVAIDLNGSETYEINSPVSLRYTLENKYPKDHDKVPLTLKIVNLNTGKTVKTMTVNKNNVKKQTTVYDVIPPFELPAGTYRADVTIPHYVGETTYENNKDSFEFIVRPYVPDSVECKTLNLDHVKTIEGEPGVSKFCIGQTPNYPSTRVEEGQGTMFFVMYRLLPTPVPAYEVTNLDESGMFQSYKLRELPTQKGADNSFIHFPSNSNNAQKLGGPYVAGLHEFYHYLYRGRMLPTEVTFEIKVSDPNGKAIPSASGEIFYKIDRNKCFDTSQIDLKNNTSIVNNANVFNPCGQVFFYLPKEPSDSVIYDLQNVPSKNDLLHFANPGYHTFDIKANEKQIYVYQKDLGSASETNGIYKWNYKWSQPMIYGNMDKQ